QEVLAADLPARIGVEGLDDERLPRLYLGDRPIAGGDLIGVVAGIRDTCPDCSEVHGSPAAYFTAPMNARFTTEPASPRPLAAVRHALAVSPGGGRHPQGSRIPGTSEPLLAKLLGGCRKMVEARFLLRFLCTDPHHGANGREGVGGIGLIVFDRLILDFDPLG